VYNVHEAQIYTLVSLKNRKITLSREGGRWGLFRFQTGGGLYPLGGGVQISLPLTSLTHNKQCEQDVWVHIRSVNGPIT